MFCRDGQPAEHGSDRAYRQHLWFRRLVTALRRRCHPVTVFVPTNTTSTAAYAAVSESTSIKPSNTQAVVTPNPASNGNDVGGRCVKNPLHIGVLPIAERLPVLVVADARPFVLDGPGAGIQSVVRRDGEEVHPVFAVGQACDLAPGGESCGRRGVEVRVWRADPGVAEPCPGG